MQVLGSARLTLCCMKEAFQGVGSERVACLSLCSIVCKMGIVGVSVLIRPL